MGRKQVGFLSRKGAQSALENIIYNTESLYLAIALLLRIVLMLLRSIFIKLNCVFY